MWEGGREGGKGGMGRQGRGRDREGMGEGRGREGGGKGGEGGRDGMGRDGTGGMGQGGRGRDGEGRGGNGGECFQNVNANNKNHRHLLEPRRFSKTRVGSFWGPFSGPKTESQKVKVNNWPSPFAPPILGRKMAPVFGPFSRRGISLQKTY